MSKADKSSTNSEYLVASKWDMVVEAGLRKMFGGIVVGVVPAALAARSGRPRLAMGLIGFGAGVGVGAACVGRRGFLEPCSTMAPLWWPESDAIPPNPPGPRWPTDPGRRYGDAKHDFFSSAPAPRIRVAPRADERRASIPYSVKPWAEPEPASKAAKGDAATPVEDLHFSKDG